MKYLRTLIFGERAVGEKLPPPTVTTTYPSEQPADFNEWITDTLNHLRDKRKIKTKKKVGRSSKKA
jgi:hypothetical protein